MRERRGRNKEEGRGEGPDCWFYLLNPAAGVEILVSVNLVFSIKRRGFVSSYL